MCHDCGCGLTGDIDAEDLHRHLHEAQERAGTGGRAEVQPQIFPHTVVANSAQMHLTAKGFPTAAHRLINSHLDAPSGSRLTLHQSLLAKNDHLAQHNRETFQANGLTVLNFLSSPGTGKTALIERMLRDRPDWQAGVVVGDLATENDADRIRRTGAPAVQIATGTACHLEAAMVARAIERLDLERLNLLIIENVGNLVCPAVYDLGEDLRVVLLSVTEGEDKPLKYPPMFKAAQVVVITKIDLAEAVAFDRSTAIANLQHMAPQAPIFEVSARTGQGLQAWYTYLESHLNSFNHRH